MKQIDFNQISEIFEYSENSPSFLVWKIDRGSRAKAGNCAGSVSNKGYYRVKINSIPYQAHRVVWCLFNGNISDEYVINHIDGNTLNNNINNLELCTQADNNRRQKQHTDNTTRTDNKLGIRGLSLVSMGSNTYVTASLIIGKIPIRKNFKYTDNKSKDTAIFDAMSYLEEITGNVQYISC